MATVITAGNATNGLSLSADNTGTMQIKTGTGAGTTAISIDANQNVTIAGTLTATGGISGGIRSGTAVASTSGTSIDFTSLPTGLKRITVMFNEISTNGASNKLIQIGSGSVQSTGYISSGALIAQSTSGLVTSSTAGFLIWQDSAPYVFSGHMVLTLISGNTWISSHYGKGATTLANVGGGSVTLSGVLDRVRITTVNGTDTFDAGSINILYE